MGGGRERERDLSSFSSKAQKGNDQFMLKDP